MNEKGYTERKPAYISKLMAMGESHENNSIQWESKKELEYGNPTAKSS
jgi:hypothetical protein